MAEQIGKRSVADLSNGFIVPLSLATGYQAKGQSKMCRPIHNASRSFTTTAYPSMLLAERVQAIRRAADGDSVLKEPKDIISSFDQLEEIATAEFLAEMGQPIGRKDLSATECILMVHRHGRGNFEITNQGNILSYVRPCGTALHKKLELVDASGVGIVTLQDKYITTHKKWTAKRKGPDGEDVQVFSVKKAHMFQRNTCLNVYLGDKKSSGKSFDYQLRGIFKHRNCHIYVKGSSEAIAQMYNGASQDEFMMRINPDVDDVDYAVMVALIGIADANESRGTIKGASGKAATKLGQVAVGCGLHEAFSACVPF